MPSLLPPQDAAFLMLETAGHPMHVGGLQLFTPAPGETTLDVRGHFEKAVADGDVNPLFRKRVTRSLGTFGQWAWTEDGAFDLDHHVRFNSLPEPGRILELLALVSRLHSTRLDRNRPLWELHVIEGLQDDRIALYFKVHHALFDGVSAARLLSRALSTDADERGMPAPWALPERRREPRSDGTVRSTGLSRVLGEVSGLPGALERTVSNALNHHAAAISFAAPKTVLNAPISSSRRFAAQSWPLRRLRDVAHSTGTTVNDVVLAMCAGALRSYLIELDALPDDALIAMVPVSLHGEDTGRPDGGNSIGAVMCELGTNLDDPITRLYHVHDSMRQGKESFARMTPAQTLVMSGLGLSPLVLQPLLGLTGKVRPPFNVTISNVPGPAEPRFWNGARLDGLYPVSIPLDGQALNITCTSYDDTLAFGLTGCARTVPHLQRLLGHLDVELTALEEGVARDRPAEH